MTTNNGLPEVIESGGESREHRRVLLIVDHNLFREALALVLEQHAGFSDNAQAESLIEARRSLDGPESERPDLVILDLDLRAGDRTDLVREINQTYAGVPVLMLTADRAQGLEVGEVLAPTVPVEEILAAARRLVGD